VFRELQEVSALYNERRDSLVSLLTFPTTRPADAVPQNIIGDRFERATEFGVPKATGRDTPLLVGYTFADYDLAGRWTSFALRDMSLDQIRHSYARALAGDSVLQTEVVLNRLFSPVAKPTNEGNTSYPLYVGTDGAVPPPVLGRTFTSSEKHIYTTENATLDSGDIEGAIRQIKNKNFGRAPGSSIVILCNADVEAEQIATWRAGVESRSGGPKAGYDFIPATANTPPYLTTEHVVGAMPPADIAGVPISGSYAGAFVLPLTIIPAGYVLVAATSGADNPQNVVGFREHPSPDWQGFRVIPGNQGRYPLVESFYQRSFGVGVRYRGAAVALQVTASSTYTTPTINAA
jgi:hypothetical protein